MLNNIHRLIFAMLAFSAPCLGSGLAIHPMEIFTTPTESAIYFASNQLSEAIAVEVVIEKWTINANGEEVRTPTDELISHPSQFILKGGTFKKVKVGPRAPDSTIDREQCYRVTIRELPISLQAPEPGTFRIHQAAAYRTSYYVQPMKRDVDLQLTQGKLDDQDTLRFSLTNAGSVHVHLRNPTLVCVLDNGQEMEITDKEALKSVIGENMHAGAERRFAIDLSALKLPGKIVSASLKFKDAGPISDKVFVIF